MHRLVGEVASPELQRLFEVVLGSVAVVDGEVGHGEAMARSWQPLDNALHALLLELVAEALDDLGRRRLVVLGKGDVELAADRGKVVVGRVGLVGDERARMDASGGGELVRERCRDMECEACAHAVADADLWPRRGCPVVGDTAWPM